MSGWQDARRSSSLRAGSSAASAPVQALAGIDLAVAAGRALRARRSRRRRQDHHHPRALAGLIAPTRATVARPRRGPARAARAGARAPRAACRSSTASTATSRWPRTCASSASSSASRKTVFAERTRAPARHHAARALRRPARRRALRRHVQEARARLRAPAPAARAAARRAHQRRRPGQPARAVGRSSTSFVARGHVACSCRRPYMDEAARCHRVGLLHRGQDHRRGAPSALSRRLDYEVLEVTGGEREALHTLARQQPAAWSRRRPRGARLRAVVLPGARPSSRARSRGPVRALHGVAPSFEDRVPGAGRGPPRRSAGGSAPEQNPRGAVMKSRSIRSRSRACAVSSAPSSRCAT